ncbi:hypothetical protein [Paenibacillus sp. FSL H3-0333]|uniref:hypothetical protein n=1 Tax=Paenibacillus sp. FSL H3-0333 TaxID=2921373 RepID=UPI0030FB20A0
MGKYLYEFHWDCGRQGDVEGLFVATQEQIDNAIGKEVYFGEILGKHSEIFGELEKCDIKKLEISSEVVSEVSNHLGLTWSGYNPLHYLRYKCTKCGDEYPGEEMICIDPGNEVCDYCTEEDQAKHN